MKNKKPLALLLAAVQIIGMGAFSAVTAMNDEHKYDLPDDGKGWEIDLPDVSYLDTSEDDSISYTYEENETFSDFLIDEGVYYANNPDEIQYTNYVNDDGDDKHTSIINAIRTTFENADNTYIGKWGHSFYLYCGDCVYEQLIELDFWSRSGGSWDGNTFYQTIAEDMPNTSLVPFVAYPANEVLYIHC